MAKSRARTWLSSLFKKAGQHPEKSPDGFTLIEILVSLFVASLVVSGLLYLVVELLRIDRRELTLETVQRDMQRAMDYISDDLREAVYIYSTPSEITDALDDTALDTDIATDGAVPVLAFWRIDEIDVANDTALPNSCATEGTNSTTCEVIKTRRASYTLVVYYQEPQYENWEGESVIKRYELVKYEDLNASGADKYDITTGYLDPVTEAGTIFEDWPTELTADADGNSSVLVDYVSRIAIDDTASVDCNDLINESTSPLTGASVTGEAYVLAPTDATSTTGFYACVSNPEEALFRTNQDVYIFLQGNADAVTELLAPASDESRLPVLQTQVKLGGVINRDGE